MQIKNGRLYQLLLDKLHIAFLALMGALAIRTASRAWVVLIGCLKPAQRRAPDENQVALARARVSAAYKKPVLTRGEAAPSQGEPGLDLSIIVPVYNPGEFLEPCVQSVYGQKTRYRFELILIDDGSDDETRARLARFSPRDDTFVFRQTNAGAAAARNLGLDRARGEYIMFLDADDMLNDGAIEALMSAAGAQGADWVQGSWEYIDGPHQIFPNAVYEGDKRMALIELPGMPWGKVFRRTLFDKLRFPAGYTSYVDTPIKCLTLRMCARAATIENVVYAWRRNPGGITFTSKQTPRALQTYWIMEQMREDSEALGLNKDALYRAIWIRQMLTVNYDRLKGLDRSLQRDVFLMACDFLAPVIKEAEKSPPPFALKLACRAFACQDFKLWSLLGRFYPLIL